jgi:hypothetical protein
LDPAVARSGLTLWTMSVPAAVIRDGGPKPAAGALVDVTAESGGATPRNGPQDFDVLPADPLTASFDECFSRGADDIGHLEEWQQKDGLQFGRKRYRFALARVEMGQSRIDGLFQAHYFQPLGRLRNPRAHDSWRICMGQLGPHSGRDKSLSIQVWKNAGCLDKYDTR